MSKKFIFVLLFGGIIVFNACNSGGKKKAVIDTANLSTEVKEGLKLMEQNCYVCHSPTASEKSRLAPPMIAIKKHYIEEREGITEAQFVKELTDFVRHPSEEKSRMPGAVKRFGVMQPMPFSEEQLGKIAKAIYQVDIPAPDWFEEHYQNRKKGNATSALKPMETGKKLALQTKGVLGGNLMTAIQEKGTDGALEFCSTRAIPLTDSMSVALNASIKRVSDKNRNPNNVANTEELAYIKAAKVELAEGKDISPKLTTKDGRHFGYYPIMTKEMCMQCHGEKNTQIKASTLEAIEKAYPNDKATDYGVNELRGIWVVEFDAS